MSKVDKSPYDKVFQEIMHYHFYGRHKKKRWLEILRNITGIFFLFVFVFFPQSVSFSESENLDRQIAFQWTRLRTVQIEVYKLKHFITALLERELVKTGKIKKKPIGEEFILVQNKLRDH